MAAELDMLLEEKEKLKQKQDENEKQLQNKAAEFLVLAHLTVIDVTLPNRFEKTKKHYESSLTAARNSENIFAFALFLQDHYQFVEAQALYTEVLKLYRDMAQENPQTFRPQMAMVLNNLGLLATDNNEPSKAEEYLTEILQLYRELAQDNPKTFRPQMAMVASNMSAFYLSNKPNRQQSLALAQEAARCAFPFLEFHIGCQQTIVIVKQIARGWSLDADDFLEDCLTDER